MAIPHLDTATAPLALLGDVAAILAGNGDIVRKATRVLDATARATGAGEVSLWLATSNGFVVAARAGTVTTSTVELAPLLEGGDGDAGPLCVRALVAGHRRLGALVVRVDGGVAPDVAMAVGTIAAMLAPALAVAELGPTRTADDDQSRRQAEDERRLLTKVIDALPVSLYVVDREYRITVWNRNREVGAQGVTREQALGKTLFEVLHRAPAEKLRRELEEVFSSGRIQQFDMETRATGEARTYRITKIPMRLADGEPISHVVTIGEDVTDFAVTKERFARAGHLAAVGQLAATMIPELDAPLAAISSAAGRSEDGADLVAAADRCRTLLGSLLAAGRSETGVRSALSLATLAEQALAQVRREPGFAPLNVQAFLDSDVPSVQGDPEQLQQALLALLRNAAEASGGTGTVTVRVRAAGVDQGGAIVEVIDEGRGIPRADLPRIFEPFFSARPSGRGAGLGLSICFSIITSHGGRLEVDSAVGAGSTFRILLPPGAAS